MSFVLFTSSDSLAVNKRIAGFDMLRGLAALAVATHHLLDWHEIATFYSWGAYGVYLFFVLSGASIWVAYSNRLRSGYSITKFLAFRLVRLCPLYISVVLIALTYQIVKSDLNWTAIGQSYLNLFFLFGFGNPGATSRVVGGWSLGIEFVFYLIFPIALSILSGKSWPWILLLTFTSQHIFINLAIANINEHETNWNQYTQFLSFIFYFSSGCAIGRAILEGKLREHKAGLATMATCIFIIGIPTGPNWVGVRTGLFGIALSIISVLTVVASATINFNDLSRRVAEILGKSSYGVYILHPLVAKLVDRFYGFFSLSSVMAILLTLTLSFALSLLLERYFESPIQQYFKRRLA
jgi:peptidoglycan/LPS O-acetylase OafA/YrhL